MLADHTQLVTNADNMEIPYLHITPSAMMSAALELQMEIFRSIAAHSQVEASIYKRHVVILTLVSAVDSTQC